MCGDPQPLVLASSNPCSGQAMTVAFFPPSLVCQAITGSDDAAPLSSSDEWQLRWLDRNLRRIAGVNAGAPIDMVLEAIECRLLREGATSRQLRAEVCGLGLMCRDSWTV
jgi:hypothetical protein